MRDRMDALKDVLAGAADGDGMVRISRGEMGRRLGCSRQHATRVLLALADAGEIAIDGEAVALADPHVANLACAADPHVGEIACAGPATPESCQEVRGAVALPAELRAGKESSFRSLRVSNIPEGIRVPVVVGRVCYELGNRVQSQPSNLSMERVEKMGIRTLHACAREAGRSLAERVPDGQARARLLLEVVAEARAALAARQAGQPRQWLTMPLAPPPAPTARLAAPQPGPGASAPAFRLDPGRAYSGTEVAAMLASLVGERYRPVSPIPPTPIDAMVAIWNEAAVRFGLSRCTVINDQRRRDLGLRWRQHLGGNLELWRAVCERVGHNPWATQHRVAIDHVLFNRGCARYVDEVNSFTTVIPAEAIAELDRIRDACWRREIRRICLDAGLVPSEVGEARFEAMVDQMVGELPHGASPDTSIASIRKLLVQAGRRETEHAG